MPLRVWLSTPSDNGAAHIGLASVTPPRHNAL
jgi:hypothetical protein